MEHPDCNCELCRSERGDAHDLAQMKATMQAFEMVLAQRDALLTACKAALDEFGKANPFDRRGVRTPSPAEILMQDAVKKCGQ